MASDSDVPLCPLVAVIDEEPPGESKPITTSSLRGVRGVCSLSPMYPDFSGNRGASDAPEKFSLFDEEKPRLMSVKFFEHRPSLAPPSFLQPGEKLVNGDLYLFTCIRPVCPPDPRPLHLSLTLPSSGSCRGVQLNWGRRR